MINKVRFDRSLNFKIVCFTMAVLIVFVAFFFVGRALGYYYIDNYYMSASRVSARRAEIYNEFRDFVQKNQISAYDTTRIERWSDSHPYASVTVRRDKSMTEAASAGMSNSYIVGNAAYPPASNSSVPTASDYSSTYYMRFYDGVHQISIADTSQTRQYQLFTLFAVAIDAVLMLLAMFIYASRISKRVTQLARSAQEIGCGNLSLEVPVKGRDEIALLAQEMDDMRRSVVERINSEHKAWQANSQLVTALSHDLRTPMTAMIGYLELLENNEYTDEEQRKRFIDTAHRKAMEMKDMTDELFRYFLAFSSFDAPLELEPYDAGILLDQLLGENIIELTDEGYHVRNVRFSGGCSIRVDALSLKRIFDNLFSNIRKYAAPSRPVVIMSELIDGKYLSICFSNTIKKRDAQTESTNIGLQSCSRISERLGGTFKIDRDDEHFSAEVILPAYPPMEETP